jgi:hypothetical protein
MVGKAIDIAASQPVYSAFFLVAAWLGGCEPTGCRTELLAITGGLMGELSAVTGWRKPA